MPTFWDKFNQEIDNLREQGSSVSSEVESFQREFKEASEGAENLFREQERAEEEIRETKKASAQ